MVSSGFTRTFKYKNLYVEGFHDYVITEMINMLCMSNCWRVLVLSLVCMYCIIFSVKKFWFCCQLQIHGGVELFFQLFILSFILPFILPFIYSSFHSSFHFFLLYSFIFYSFLLLFILPLFIYLFIYHPLIYSSNLSYILITIQDFIHSPIFSLIHWVQESALESITSSWVQRESIYRTRYR